MSHSVVEPSPPPTWVYLSASAFQIHILEVDWSIQRRFSLPIDGRAAAVRTLVQRRSPSSSKVDAAASARSAADSAFFTASFKLSKAIMVEGVRGKPDEVGLPEMNPRKDFDFAIEPLARDHETTSSILPRSSVSMEERTKIIFVVAESNTHYDAAARYGRPSWRVMSSAGVPSGQALQKSFTSIINWVALFSPCKPQEIGRFEVEISMERTGKCITSFKKKVQKFCWTTQNMIERKEKQTVGYACCRERVWFWVIYPFQKGVF